MVFIIYNLYVIYALPFSASNLRSSNPINADNLKIICKGKNPTAFKSNILNLSRIAKLEQDEMLKIATWKNDSICPINEKIETDYIEFPVAYFGLDDELFSSHHKLFGFATDFKSRFLFLLSPFSSLLKSSLDPSPPQ